MASTVPVQPYALAAVDHVRELRGEDASFTDNDALYSTLLNIATGIVENWTGVRYRVRQGPAEFFDGGGVYRLLTNRWPLIDTTSTISVWEDSLRVFGSDTLLASDAFALNARIGEIRKTRGVFGNFSQNVKVLATSGYGIVIEEGLNDTIDIKEVSEFPIAVSAAEYSELGLASALQVALNASEDLSNTYTVTYNRGLQTYTIAADGAFSILWTTGATNNASLQDALGYDIADTASGTSHTADSPVSGLTHQRPEVVSATVRMVNHDLELTRAGGAHGELIAKDLSSTQIRRRFQQYISDPYEPSLMRLLEMLTPARFGNG